MFEVAINFITQFCNYIPIFIPLILVFNLFCSVLWGKE